MLANTIQVNEIISGIYNVLSVRSEITDKLALTPPFDNASGTKARKNSIVPMSHIMEKTLARPTPLIGIRSGTLTKVGNHTFDAFIFIRCYTGIDKSFVLSNEIMSLVNNSLDGQLINMDSAVLAEMTLEQMSGEEYDEGYKLNYREAQFKLTIT